MPTRTPEPGTIQINFQPNAAPSSPGYWVDAGSSFADRGNGYGYGWSSNNTTNTRDRNASNSPDQRFDTFAFMQRNAARRWEVAVPNGNYKVTIVAGDATATNSIYKLSAEGVLLVDGVPTSATRWFTGTATVQVTDGRLTIDNAPGSSNNKICFIEIVPSTAQATPQNILTSTLAAQTNFSVAMDKQGARLDWSLASDVAQANNIAGFHVYRSATVSKGDAQILTSELIRVSRTTQSTQSTEEGYSFVDGTVQSDAFYNYWITAVDATSNTTDIGPVMESLLDRVTQVYLPIVTVD
jgi:hypothetical protein